MMSSEGNWVELDQDGLFVIIGNSTHGKTILNRALKSDFTIKQALKAGFLSFDSTRLSANDVDFPIDVAVYKRDSFILQEHRYEEQDLAALSKYWEDEVREALERMPGEWIDAIENN